MTSVFAEKPTEDVCRECGEHLGFGLPIFHLSICDDCDGAGDDLCDICMRSGRAVSRTTFSGKTVCEDQDCQDEADRLDAEHNEEEGDDGD